PVLDLDASTAGTGYTAFVISNSGGAGAKSIADTDITITDLDNTHITGATITLVGPQDSGHSLTVAGLPAGITASAYNPATGVLTLSGSATLADYQAAIQAIKFMSTDATQTTRTIEITVTDGTGNSNTANTTIQVVGST